MIESIYLLRVSTKHALAIFAVATVYGSGILKQLNTSFIVNKLSNLWIAKSRCANTDDLLKDLYDNTSDGMFSLLNQMLIKQPTDENQIAPDVKRSPVVPPPEIVSIPIADLNPTTNPVSVPDQEISENPEPQNTLDNIKAVKYQNQNLEPNSESTDDSQRIQAANRYWRQPHNKIHAHPIQRDNEYGNQYDRNDDEEGERIINHHHWEDESDQHTYPHEYNEDEDASSDAGDDDDDDDGSSSRYPVHRYRRRTINPPNSYPAAVPITPSVPPVTNNINISTNIKCDVVNNVINNGVTYKDTVDANSYGHGTNKYVDHNLTGYGNANIHKNISTVTVNNVINSVDLNDPRTKRVYHHNVRPNPTRIHNTIVNAPKNGRRKLPILKPSHSQSQSQKKQIN